MEFATKKTVSFSFSLFNWDQRFFCFSNRMIKKRWNDVVNRFQGEKGSSFFLLLHDDPNEDFFVHCFFDQSIHIFSQNILKSRQHHHSTQFDKCFVKLFLSALPAKTRRAGSFFCPSKKPPSTVWSAAVEHATSAGLADAVQTFWRSMARRFAGQLPDAQRILRIARICSDRRPREGGCRGRPNDGKWRVICWPVITSPIFGRNELGYEWWTGRSQTLESLTQGWGHTGLWGRAEAVCVWSRSGTGFVLRLVWIVVRNEVVVVVDVAVP